ncbi:hypothetical protein CQ047_17490 [Microbacterium sp. MYb72]|nr:hypothetical protein CQ047_17490 [Microbacterium sp. MYb72]
MELRIDDGSGAAMHEDLLAHMDRIRSTLGYRPVSDLLADAENVFIDPFSALVSRQARIGSGNIFYPHVRIDAGAGVLTIGDRNRFFEGTRMDAADDGSIEIGDENEFGPHAVAVLANTPGAAISIGHRIRLRGRIDVLGTTRLEDGSQILGDITAVDVSLAGGDSYADPDPDARGAVLKGRGRAKGITLDIGTVINGDGDLALFPVEAQSVYHPKPADAASVILPG